MTTRPCKACGREIAFVPTGATKDDGSPVLLPLRRVRKVYAISGAGLAEVVLAGGDATYISHYEDCPAASSFSKKPKKETT